MVFSPVAGQRRLTINQLAALEEISEIIHTVIVKRVGIERRLTVLKYHIVTGLCQLVVTIIVGVVAEQFQRVAL